MRRLLILGVLSALPVAAFAQSEPAATDAPVVARDRITLGIAAGVTPDYDGSNDYRLSPGGLVQGQVSGFDFTARGTNIFIDLLREPPRSRIDLVAGPVVQLRLERNGTVRDSRVAALGKIKPALELGGYIGVGTSGLLNRFDKLSFDVSYRADIGSVHKSATISPTISYVTPLSRRTLAVLAVTADHVGRGYGRTYFDVPVNAVGLTPYAVRGAGWKNVGANILLVQSLGRDIRRGWSLFALGGYSKLLGQYARSPIVADAGSANQSIGFAGLAYSF